MYDKLNWEFFLNMKYMKHIIFLLGLFCVVNVEAQQAIPLSGGAVSAQGGSFSYSVGQMVMMSDVEPAVTVNVVTASIIEGVQQPYTIDQIAIADVVPLAAELKIYPNPTTRQITIETVDSDLRLDFSLYSASGQLLQTGRFESLQVLDLGRFAAGTYLLSVQDENHSQNNYRIIKVD